MAETVHPASIVEETRRRYLTYALSVISSRALPDVRDGLKPVQRRILYAMHHDLQIYYDRRNVKCARICGEVTGKYHPHGDVAVYDALVRMAQDFTLRMPLVKGEGNFGSIEGHSAAAPRYTLAKLSPTASHLLEELRQHTVTMRPNYEGNLEEPVVLPAQFPNLLVNGVSGIAVGMATNIPPHNLGEVLRGCILLIENPESTTAQIMEKIKGPDFPLGGRIVSDRTDLRKIYEEGQGSIKVQAEWKLEESDKRNQKQIVITSLPYSVNSATVQAQIGEIIEARKLPQLLDMTNLTSEDDGFKISLEIKADADPNLVMAYLYKHTPLQDNFAFNMTCLVPDKDGHPQPMRLGLKDLLQHFLDFRFETVKRRYEYELELLRKRIHILEGFAIIFNALDRALKMIRESQGKADACEKLMAAFKLDKIQADAVLEAQIYKIAQLEIQDILEELADKQKKAAKIEAILNSKKKLWDIVKDELTNLEETLKSRMESQELEYSGRRRTKLGSSDDALDFDPEAYIVRENTNIVVTQDGWIKRIGRLASVEGTRVREGDAVLAVVPSSTLDHVIFFADDGSAYTMRANEVPATAGYGDPITKFFKLGDKVKLIAGCTTDTRFVPQETKPSWVDEPPGPLLLVVTQQGMTLRTPLAPFRTASNKLGRRYVKLGDGDRVVMVQVLTGDEESIFLVSASGRVLHFDLSEINVLSGVGKGVIGIKLEEGDTCLGGTLITRKSQSIQVETSGGKTMEFTGRHEVVSRGGKGFEAVKRTNFARIIPPPIELVDWDQVEGKTEPEKKPNDGPQSTLF